MQAGHALAEFLLENPKTNWTNGTLVYLGVKNQIQLENWIHKLTCNGVDYSEFREPDIGNEVTAIATLGQDNIFKGLNLMK